MAGSMRAAGLLGVITLLGLAALVQSADGAEKGEDHVDFCDGQALLGSLASSSFRAEAQLVPGASGAELVCASGDKGFDHVDFRVAFHPDGRVDVNGEDFALCDPVAECRIALTWAADAGALAVQVEEADGSLAVAQYHLPEAPTELRIEAAEVSWLSVTPQ